MKAGEDLNKFGEFVVAHLRDWGIEFTEKLLVKHWKAPALQKLEEELQTFSDKEKDIIMQVVIEAIDNSIHNFLFALEEENARNDNGIQILIGNKNVVELSDGLCGEAYGEDGWYAKYSKYK